MPIRHKPNDCEKTNNSVEKNYAKDENFEQPKNVIPRKPWYIKSKNKDKN